MSESKSLTPATQDELLNTLKSRFEKNTSRHPDIKWVAVEEKLKGIAGKLWSLSEMERTGGEPDVVEFKAATGEYVFYDCSAESPAGRRSLCYDHEALNERKENKPANSAVAMADEMGIELLNEAQYRALQQSGKFDLKHPAGC